MNLNLIRQGSFLVAAAFYAASLAGQLRHEMAQLSKNSRMAQGIFILFGWPEVGHGNLKIMKGPWLL